jgi:uncharacterized membrane protein YgcG
LQWLLSDRLCGTSHAAPAPLWSIVSAHPVVKLPFAASFTSILFPPCVARFIVETADAFLKDPTMGKKLYVGNLSYSVDDHSLNQNFSDFGTVSSAKVMMDRDSGRSKGFGFVEMSSDAEAQAAISGMNGKNVDGRDMVVNEARPMEPRTGGGGGGYGGGRSGGGGGGYGGGGNRY